MCRLNATSPLFVSRNNARYRVENVNSVFDQNFAHPRHRVGNHKNHDDDFKDDGNRLFLNLSKCLKQTDEQTDDRTGNENRRTDHQRHPNGVPVKVNGSLSIHHNSGE